jgi:anaerobic selenocysteine-containing dehydrogenase
VLPVLESADKFLLLIPNTLYAWERNRMIAESPVLYIEYQAERPALKMNLQDAKDLKFRPGEKAKIRSERGELQVALQADEGVPRRTLVLSSHFLNLVESVAGKGEIDPVTRSVYFPSLLVTVEKA